MKGTPHIRRFAIRLFVALLTFLIGVTTFTVWFRNHPPAAKSFRFLSGPTCRAGLVSVESQPAALLHITVSDSECRDRQTANVQFLVENLSTKPISKYEIRAVQTYDELIEDGLGVTAVRGEPLEPRETETGFLGGGVLNGAGGKPVGEMKGFQLVVWSIEFADGTTWTRNSPK